MFGRFVYVQLVIILMVTALHFIGLPSSIVGIHYLIIVEMIYTISFLTVIGWVIWWQIIENYPMDIKSKYLQWSLLLITVHVMCFIVLIGENINGQWHEIRLQYVILLFLIAIGFPFLFKTYSFDTVWLFLLVICQQYKQGVFQSIAPFSIFVLTSIHLIVASIWVGGLTFVVIFWKRYKRSIHSFLPIFIEYTLFCLTIMALTGSISVSIHFTSIHHYFSYWGLLFLVKLLLVCLIIVVMIRIQRKKKFHTSKYWVIINYVVMVLIMILVISLNTKNFHDKKRLFYYIMVVL